MEKQIKYAVWAAVSKEHQAKPDKVSLAEQVALAHRRADERGWKTSGLEYIIPGESRTLYVNLRDAENSIPELKAMLDDAQNGKFNLLILYDYNRLRDLMDPVAKTLAAYGVQLYSVSQPADPVSPESFTAYTSDSESMLRGMAQIISRAQISDIQRKNAYAMPKRITERGLPHKVPYGYIHVKNGPPLVDPVTAKAVILAKDLMLSGHSLRQTCDALEAQGFPAPRGGSAWYPQTLRDMMLNPFYAGEVTWMREQVRRDPRTGRRTTRPTPERTVRGQGAHEPLWGREEHERLTTEVGRRDKTFIGKRANLFSGLLACGNCGAPMHLYKAPRVPERRYVLAELGAYRCRGNGVACMAIGHEDLFERFTSRLQIALESVRPQPVDAAGLADRLKAETEKKDRLTEAYLAGAYSLPEYLGYKAPVDESIDQLSRQINSIEETIRLQAERMAQARYILDNWRDFVASLRADADAQAGNHTLRAVISRIVVKRDDLEIEFL